MRRLALLLTLALGLLAPRTSRAGPILIDFGPSASENATSTSLAAAAGVPATAIGAAPPLQELDVTVLGSLRFAPLDSVPGPVDGVPSFALTLPLAFERAEPIAAGGVLGAGFAAELFDPSVFPPLAFPAPDADRGASPLLDLPFTFRNGQFAATLSLGGNEVARTLPPAAPDVAELSLIALLGLGLALLAGARIRRSR